MHSHFVALLSSSLHLTGYCCEASLSSSQCLVGLGCLWVAAAPDGLWDRFLNLPVTLHFRESVWLKYGLVVHAQLLSLVSSGAGGPDRGSLAVLFASFRLQLVGRPGQGEEERDRPPSPHRSLSGSPLLVTKISWPWLRPQVTGTQTRPL